MDDPLIDIRAKLQVLEQENEGLRQALVAIAASLSRENLEAARRTLTLLTLTSACMRLYDGPNSSFGIDAVIRHLLALTKDGVDPEAALGVRALQAIDAGPDRVPALTEWIAQASVEEGADDIRQLLKRYARPPAAAPKRPRRKKGGGE